MFEKNISIGIKFIEKGLLTLIAILTVIATFQEIIIVYEAGKVNLADLL